MDLTSDMDEDELDNQPAMFSVKGSPKMPKPFRGSPSPTKVAQQHLERKAQDVREARSKEQEDRLMIKDRDVNCSNLKKHESPERYPSSTWWHGLAFLWQKHFSWLDEARRGQMN